MADVKQPSFFELFTGNGKISEGLQAAEDQLEGIKASYFDKDGHHSLDENGNVVVNKGDSKQVRDIRKRFFSESESVRMPVASHKDGKVELSPFDVQYVSAGSIPLAWFYKVREGAWIGLDWIGWMELVALDEVGWRGIGWGGSDVMGWCRTGWGGAGKSGLCCTEGDTTTG